MGRKVLDASIFTRNKVEDAMVNDFGAPDYDITEDTLNAYIANVTISLMSLNRGTETRKCKLHQIPHNLCLLFPAQPHPPLHPKHSSSAPSRHHRHLLSTPQRGLGHRRRFLQIMTTTIGRSRMEELVVQHHAEHDGDSVPKELT